MNIDEIKGEVAKRMGLICYIGVKSASVDYVADSILSIVIQKGGVCPECDGSRMSNPDDFDQNYEPCERCGGSGKFDITVRDAINKVKGDG